MLIGGNLAYDTFFFSPMTHFSLAESSIYISHAQIKNDGLILKLSVFVSGFTSFLFIYFSALNVMVE